MRPATDGTSRDGGRDGQGAPETHDNVPIPRRPARWHNLPAASRQLYATALRLPPAAIAYRYVVTTQGADLAAGIAFRFVTYLLPLIGSLLALAGVVLRDPGRRARMTQR
jgi:hypothetical protein